MPTITDYRNGIRERFRSAVENANFGLSVKPQPLDFRRKALWLLEEELSASDSKIIERFFDIHDGDNARKKVEDFANGLYRPIKALFTTEIRSEDEKMLDLAALMVDFNPRPFRKFATSDYVVPKAGNPEKKVVDIPVENAAEANLEEKIENSGVVPNPEEEVKNESVDEDLTQEIKEGQEEANEPKSEDVLREKIPEFEDDLEAARVFTLNDVKAEENAEAEMERKKAEEEEKEKSVDEADAETQVEVVEERKDEQGNSPIEEKAETASDVAIEETPEIPNLTKSKSVGEAIKPTKPTKIPAAKRNIIAASLLILSSATFYLTVISRKKECMQWRNYQYELVNCNPSSDPDNLVTPFDSAQFPMKQIKVSKTTVFFVKGNPIVWYSKHDNVYDFFNQPGYHPISRKTLNEISSGIATDVQEGRIISASEK